jgi:hypothetical protein
MKQWGGLSKSLSIATTEGSAFNNDEFLLKIHVDQCFLIVYGTLKGQPHEKVCEIMIYDGSLGPTKVRQQILKF